MLDPEQDININTLKMEIKAIKDQLTKIPDRDEVKLYIKEIIDETLKNCDKRYASRDRLGMLEKVVYGAVGAILIAFIGAVIGLVIIQ